MEGSSLKIRLCLIYSTCQYHKGSSNLACLHAIQTIKNRNRSNPYSKSQTKSKKYFSGTGPKASRNSLSGPIGRVIFKLQTAKTHSSGSVKAKVPLWEMQITSGMKILSTRIKMTWKMLISMTVMAKLRLRSSNTKIQLLTSSTVLQDTMLQVRLQHSSI